jgi:two-component system, LytTR family, response regulator
MTTLLIDDEKLALSRLKRLLAEYDFFEIIGEAANGLEGLEMIENLKPELIFLDIEMPGLNGFEMLARLTFMPVVIFATAFDQYAIRAFEENSVDYLLKPVEKERLDMTVARLKKLTTSGNKSVENQQLMQMLESFKPKKELQFISVKAGEKILLLRFEDVSYFEAEDKYTFLITTEGRKHLTDYTLTALEEKLPAHFLRISRSVIINSQLVREIQKHFSGKFVLFLSDKAQSKLESGLKYSDNVKSLLQL